MSTDLATTDPKDGALAPVLPGALAQEDLATLPLTYFRIDHKSGTFQDPDLGLTTQPPLQGIILGSGKAKFLFANDDDKVPVCKSYDCITGTGKNEAGEEVQISCATCPYDEFGSIEKLGKVGRGKACRERRHLYVLLKDAEGEWEALPVIVSVPPASLRNWKKFYGAIARTRRNTQPSLLDNIVLIGLGKVEGGAKTYHRTTFTLGGKTPKDIQKIAEQMAVLLAVRNQQKDMDQALEDQESFDK